MLLSLPPPVLLTAAAPAPDPAALQARRSRRLVGFGTRHTAVDDDRSGRAASARRGAGQPRRLTALGWGVRRLPRGRDDRRHASPGRAHPTGCGSRTLSPCSRGHDRPDARRHRPGPYRQPGQRQRSTRPSDAPGANDDGSGVAVVLEAARLLSKREVRRDDRLCRPVGRGAGAMGRAAARAHRDGTRLAGRGRPQQRHRWQHPRHRRRACRRHGSRVQRGGARGGRRPTAIKTTREHRQ